MQPTLDAQKAALRAAIRAVLPPPASEAHRAASESAQDRLADSVLCSSAQVIALYRALPRECSTSRIAARLIRLGKQVCFPAVHHDPGERVLRFRLAANDFVPGAHGIEEPTGDEIPLDRLELVVVPAQAVDRQGHRLGRGKGYYDATLAALPPTARRVALVFESQLVAEVPVGEHDQPVHVVCTEARLLFCSPEAKE